MEVGDIHLVEVWGLCNNKLELRQEALSDSGDAFVLVEARFSCESEAGNASVEGSEEAD